LDRIGKSVGEVMPLDMATAAASGDPFAASLFQRFGHYLGLGMASMVNVLGIYTIVIGGGISRSWDLFIGEARRAFQQQSYIETARITEIKRAKLGDNAGIIGAAVGAARLVR
jgi:glucokinase